MNIKSITFILLMVSLCGINSCTAPKTSTGIAANPSLQDTYWRLTELMGKPVAITPAGKREIHIKLLTEGNKVEAFAGCNGVGGTYELKDGGRIHFSNLIGTMMACDDLETENNLLEVLKIADNYNLTDKQLVLNKAKMAPLARFEAVIK